MSQETKVVWEGFVSLLIPLDWEWTDEEGTISIFNPNGVGALQLSFATNDATSINLGELTVRLSQNVGLELTPLPTQMGGAPATYIEGVSREKDPAYWRVWHSAKRDRVARVTYTCAASEISVEKNQVDRILATWSWLV